MKDQVSGARHIPEKVYFRIGEVSDLVGVETHVLRYWESEFKLVRPRRAKSNQRLYRRQDVEALLLIRELLHERGYTINGARKYLEQRTSGAAPPVDSGATGAITMAQKFADIKKELKRIQQLLAMRSLRF